MEHMETFITAVIFSAIFFLGPKLHSYGGGKRHYRRLLSLGAGISVAYVFVHLLPELGQASEAFIRETADSSLPFPSYRVYLSAMLGFIIYHGMENLGTAEEEPSGGDTTQQHGSRVLPFLHIFGFAVYVWLVGYLLVDGLEHGIERIGFYSAAMGFHFLSVNHTLQVEHPRAYRKVGKNILTAAVLLGWGMGILLKFPTTVIITLLAIISGAVIVNTMISELPRKKEGHFPLFLAGACLYALLLIAAG
jgi:hypothetical protein